MIVITLAEYTTGTGFSYRRAYGPVDSWDKCQKLINHAERQGKKYYALDGKKLVYGCSRLLPINEHGEIEDTIQKEMRNQPSLLELIEKHKKQ